MQFMSQAMGLADCIISAMAPIGIITIIVSAIRVGGPTWLKAVIGRARENLSGAEIELMSSTSKETCELWNGESVIRCPGSADIEQFVCVVPESWLNGKTRPKVVFKTLEDGIKERWMSEKGKCLRAEIRRIDAKYHQET